MRRATCIEAGLIGVAVAAAWLMAANGWLPARLGSGAACLAASALLLGQGLLRDVTTLLRRRRPGQGVEASLACMCVESTAGMAGVLAGAVLVLAGTGGSIDLTPALWALAVALVLLAGLAVRDRVIAARPLRIMRVPDHGSIRVSLAGRD